jgi:hypothetical protein
VPTKENQQFNRDGRAPTKQLYTCYNRLAEQYNWQRELVYQQGTDFPVLCYRTQHIGLALWIIAGVHGEEPAGPIAIANQIDFLAGLGRQIPVVIFPLCNPKGYSRNFRYPDEYRDPKRGLSVGDSDHLLLTPDYRPRLSQPSSPAAATLTKHLLGTLERYPAALVLDHHEDEDLQTRNKHPLSYIYSQGCWGEKDAAALAIVALLQNHDIPVTTNGRTRFGEVIHNGIVVSNDGSLDELLASRFFWADNRPRSKHATPSVITIETPTAKTPLPKRVAVHEAVIRSYPDLLTLSLRQNTGARASMPTTFPRA